jgi:hypothetical protein
MLRHPDDVLSRVSESSWRPRSNYEIYFFIQYVVKSFFSRISNIAGLVYSVYEHGISYLAELIRIVAKDASIQSHVIILALYLRANYFTLRLGPSAILFDSANAR